MSSGSGALTDGVGNTPAFGQSAFGKPAVGPMRINKNIFNQTTQQNIRLFGYFSARPTFGDFSNGETLPIGVPASAPASSGRLFSQQNASTVESTSSGLFRLANPNAPLGQSAVAAPASNFSASAAAPASSEGLFGQQNSPAVGNTGDGLFGLANPNAPIGKLKPVDTGFSVEASSQLLTELPDIIKISLIGKPQTIADQAVEIAIDDSQDIIESKSVNAEIRVEPSNKSVSSKSESDLVQVPDFKPDKTEKGSISATFVFRATSSGDITIKDGPVTGISTRFEYYSVNRKVRQQDAVSSELFGSPKTLFSSTTSTSADLFETKDNKTLLSKTSTTPALGGFKCVDTSNGLGVQNQIFGKPTAFGVLKSTKSFRINTTETNTALTSKPSRVVVPQTNIFGSSTFGTQPAEFGQSGFGQLPYQKKVFVFGQNGLGSTQTKTDFGTDSSIY